MRKIPIALTGLIFLAGCVKSPPDIVLINVDDMGWRDVGFMDSEFYCTPNIDMLAEGGMVFSCAYASASNCAPSRASLMSGKWTPRHGIFTVGSSERGKSQDRKLIPVENQTVLPDQFKTIAESLKGAGYTTCHAGKWHLGVDPQSQGFDSNIGGSQAGAPKSYYPPYGNVALEAPEGEYLTDNIMNHVIEFLDSTESPFFLYYAPYAVHVPIHPVDSLLPEYENKEAWMGQSNVKYATMIDNLDRNIGNLVEVLEAKGNMRNTMIVFTSDNGGHFRITRQKPLRSGKGSYYEGGIRVPMVVNWKGKVRAGQISDEPVCQLDLYPTLLEVGRIYNKTEDAEILDLDGISLLPHLIERQVLPERALFWHFPIYLEAYDPENDETRDPLFRTRPGSVVRKGDWKLHQYFEDGGLELYNLKTDISEKNNLVLEKPEKAEELLEILLTWRKQTGAPVPSELNPEYLSH